MAPLTDAEVVWICEAAVLAGRQAAVLAEFELDLIRDICRRFRDFHREAMITAAEWQPFHDAVAAMRAAEGLDPKVMEQAVARLLSPTRAA